jgi:hypothetical protein
MEKSWMSEMEDTPLFRDKVQVYELLSTSGNDVAIQIMFHRLLLCLDETIETEDFRYSPMNFPEHIQTAGAFTDA